jgi:hypothetical protein
MTTLIQPHADADALLQHVLRLGRENHLRIIIDTALNGPTYGRDPNDRPFGRALQHEERCLCAVHIPLITNHRTYAVALHEIGHILSERGWLARRPQDDANVIPTPRNLALMLEEERAAWTWAHEHSIIEWSTEMRHFERDAFGSYEHHVKIMTQVLSWLA